MVAWLGPAAELANHFSNQVSYKNTMKKKLPKAKL
jgi:hypothetical protein